MRRLTKGLLFGAVTGIVGVVLGLTPLGLDFEKHVGLDWLFQVRGPIDPPPEVAVVAINERDIAGLGLPKLPRDWPRSIHGKLIEALALDRLSWQDYANCRGADADLFFPERGASTRRAKSICAACDVRTDCRDRGHQRQL